MIGYACDGGMERTSTNATSCEPGNGASANTSENLWNDATS